VYLVLGPDDQQLVEIRRLERRLAPDVNVVIFHLGCAAGEIFEASGRRRAVSRVACFRRVTRSGAPLSIDVT
jgi:hypothetical protein